jgi:LmbE family N-acetylglucosaminyl deacetylase
MIQVYKQPFSLDGLGVLGTFNAIIKTYEALNTLAAYYRKTDIPIMIKCIYLSPHLDDAVFSCGAIIWDQIRRHREVEIWTVFAGDPPPTPLTPFAEEIHSRWMTGPMAPRMRRAEDRLACERVGANHRHLIYPDCIYRTIPGTKTALINQNDDLFQPFPENEQPLVDEIAQLLRTLIPTDIVLMLPLTVGGHIDHQIVRRVGESLPNPHYYYADYPYVGDHPEALAPLLPSHTHVNHFPLSNQALATWQYAVEAYTSQITTFWNSISTMYGAIENYASSPNGNCLWHTQTTTRSPEE